MVGLTPAGSSMNTGRSKVHRGRESNTGRWASKPKSSSGLEGTKKQTTQMRRHRETGLHPATLRTLQTTIWFRSLGTFVTSTNHHGALVASKSPRS